MKVYLGGGLGAKSEALLNLTSKLKSLGRVLVVLKSIRRSGVIVTIVCML